MKTLFILLALFGLVICVQPSEVVAHHRPETLSVVIWETSNEKLQHLNPLQVQGSTPEPKSTPSTTTNPPVTEKSVSLDLTQRLFYADHDDLQFQRKTLDLSGLGLTGEDVMRVLHSLNASVLSSVARLDLSRNRVSRLPQRIWPLEMEYRLLELRLDHNQLNLWESLDSWAIPIELQRLLSLKKLSLSHCGLTSLTEWKLEFPPAIQTLDLSYNSLTDPPDTVTKLSALEHFNLSHNNIRYLGGFAVSHLDKLRSLDLSYNNMEKMFDDPLAELVFLETVHLDHNELSEAPKLYKFTGSYQPRINVYLRGNQFRCGSDLKDFMDTKRILIVDKSNATCLDSYQVEHMLANMTAHYWSYRWQEVQGKLLEAKGWVRDVSQAGVHNLQFLAFMLLALAVTMLAYNVLRKKRSPAPSDAPYDVLSDGPTY